MPDGAVETPICDTLVSGGTGMVNLLTAIRVAHPNCPEMVAVIKLTWGSGTFNFYSDPNDVGALGGIVISTTDRYFSVELPMAKISLGALYFKAAGGSDELRYYLVAA